MKKANSTNYTDWIEKGAHDFEDAKILIKNKGYPDTICFLAQQAAEKHLKAYLVWKHKQPRPIHNLEELVKDCGRIEKAFLRYLDECLALSPYYIETRYPPLATVVYSEDEAKNAIGLAEKIIEAVTTKLPQKKNK